MEKWITGFFFLAFCIASSEGECEFPESWRGRWYQSGLGDTMIGQNQISKKGICHERFRDLYLIENTNEHCHMCLLIMQRHHNVLQYKQSYCIGKSSLTSICQQIRVEAVLFTLIREPAEPVPCPIHNSYHYTYNNNSGGFCRSPMSYVHQCATPSKFSFKFRHCPYAAYTYEKVITLTCLATWKDGSQFLIYGGYAGDGITSREGSYRCFMYQILGSVVYMAASADASCLGLVSQRDGPFLMELTQDIYSIEQTSCTFPSWLTPDETWRDTSGNHAYVLNEERDTLTVAYRRQHSNFLHERQSHTCINSWHQDATDFYKETFTIYVKTMDDCAARFQCIRLTRLQEHVLVLEKGQYFDSKYPECDREHFQHESKQYIFPVSLAPQPCPFEGQFRTLKDHHSSCETVLRAGCDGHPASFQILSNCPSTRRIDMMCLAWWSEGNDTVILSNNSTDHSQPAGCYKMRHIDQHEMDLGLEEICYTGFTKSHGDRNYLFGSTLDECEVHTTTPKLTQILRNQADDISVLDPSDPTELSYNKNHDLSALYGDNSNRASNHFSQISHIIPLLFLLQWR